MDLFLVDNTKTSKLSPAILGYAGAALAGIYLLSKLFNKDDEDSDF